VAQIKTQSALNSAIDNETYFNMWSALHTPRLHKVTRFVLKTWR